MPGEEGGDGKADARREGERKLNGYILISFVHPQKLPSDAAPLLARIVLRGLYHFEKEAAFVLHANVQRNNLSCHETGRVNLPRNANTCAMQISVCFPCASKNYLLAYISLSRANMAQGVYFI